MCQSATPTTPPAAHACSCQQAGPHPGKRVPATPEMILPEVPFPSLRVLELAGETGLRRLVAQHHALLRRSAIGGLFAQDLDVFAQLVARVADFVVEACGGGAAYTPAHGNTCMRTRHFPFTIDESAREVWLTLLWQAMQDTDFPPAAREEYWNWMEPFSLRMVNRRTTKAQPARWAFADMPAVTPHA